MTSVASPKLGCGNGEVDFETRVNLLMEHYQRNCPFRSSSI